VIPIYPYYPPQYQQPQDNSQDLALDREMLLVQTMQLAVQMWNVEVDKEQLRVEREDLAVERENLAVDKEQLRREIENDNRNTALLTEILEQLRLLNERLK
jgi:hypothetical protein